MSSAFSELIGNPIGEAAAFAAGLAIHPLIEPLLQEEQNLTWSLYRSLPLDPDKAAELVARGHLAADIGAAEAGLTGVSTDRFDKLTLLAEVFPGLATALTLQRRNQLPPGELAVLLNRLGFNSDYQPRLASLVQNPIDPAVIAVAIQRSIMKPPFDLPVAPPTAVGLVPAFDISSLDAETEAAWSGIELERLRILNAIVGLPASPDLAARMTFRKIIERADFDRAIAEGNTRNEWRDFLFEGFREILTAGQYAELQLRGFYDAPTRRANTAKHGMSDADSDLLFNVLGRGLSEHQMVIAKARGGVYNGPIDHIPADELAALQRANLRPEYYNLAYAARYTYPSGFQIKAEAISGALKEPDTTQILLEVGWDPKWATFFAKAWAPGAKTTAAQKKQTLAHLTGEYLSGGIDKGTLTNLLTTSLGYTADQAANEIALAEFGVAKSARTKATNALEKRFVALQINQADATTALQGIGLPQGAIDQLLNAWNIERGAILTTLTLAQVQTALKNNAIPASVARPLLQDLGESDEAIATIFATYGTDPNT